MQDPTVAMKIYWLISSEPKCRTAKEEKPSREQNKETLASGPLVQAGKL